MSLPPAGSFSGFFHIRFLGIIHMIQKMGAMGIDNLEPLRRSLALGACLGESIILSSIYLNLRYLL
jgi:hypothetical protein